MTFGSLLNSHFGSHKTPLYERGEHMSYPPPWKGHSKGGGKGTQSSLSALTLLAFLFFLNILQTCLRDQLASQSPLVIMMTTTTTTTAGDAVRHKRETSSMNLKGDPAEKKLDTKKKPQSMYPNMSRKYELGSYKNSMEPEEYGLNRKILNMKVKQDQSKKSSKLGSFHFSPWLESIFCCNIISCASVKTLTISNRCY